MIESDSSMNHPKQFILVSEYLYGYTFEYEIVDNLLKKNTEVPL